MLGRGEEAAQVRVEALSQAPTHYVLRVEPTVVDGVLFESVAPVSVTVPPGATGFGVRLLEALLEELAEER